MRSRWVKMVMVACFLCSLVPVIPACGESESARVLREVNQWTAFRQRAKEYVEGAIVIKRADGICILYTETSGGNGRLPRLIGVPCPKGEETH